MGTFSGTVREIFAAGGLVMFPILLLSVLSLAITVERAIFWISNSRWRRGWWLGEVVAALRRADSEAVTRLSSRDGSVYGRFLSVMWRRGVSEAAALEAVETVRPRVERFSAVMSTIITAAPMLGILGTVTGIIQSFRLLGGESGVITDPAQVAAGIAEALYTTAFGLLVAIATLFPYVVFRTAADRCFTRIETVVAAALEGKTTSESRRAGAPSEATASPPGPGVQAQAPAAKGDGDRRS